MTIPDERRLVTVLFADLVGFTGRAEQSDPEALRTLQRTYFAAVSAEVERFGGTVEKFIGDAAMAIFGAPQAHDDDAERALRTALRIREAVAAMEGQLEVRIGVNTGEVVGGMGAGPQAGDYTVSGDAVNVAARLQQLAAPNEIMVGGPTRALSADAFAFAPREELALRGRSEPIEAWRLERELPDRPRTRGGEAKLVGRARELDAIASALDEARAGRGLMTALVGEPGIGKSRLALEARQRAEADGFASVWTSSRSYASAFPYHLLAQLIHQLLGEGAVHKSLDRLRRHLADVDAETLERWAVVVDDVLGEAAEADPQLVDLSPAGRQRLLVHAIGALLRHASRERPLLVVLDDLHWADPASLAVIEELLDILPDLRVSVLATYRSGWSHGWEGRSAYEQLNLRALRPEEARSMVGELAPGGRLSAEHTERVLERSAGNPLFLEQLLRTEEGEAAVTPHRLPETIYEMLLARLDALPAEARRTLQLASAVGMEFSERIVTALAAEGEAATPAPGTDAALRTLQRAELIAPRSVDGADRTLAFRHPLVQEVAYRSLLVSTRRGLHARIGRWLEEHGGEELLAELARHYRDSDDAAKARHYLPLAGARAESLNATHEARGWFRAAAEAFADDPVRRAEMLEAAARQTYLIGEIRAAIDEQVVAMDLYESAGAELAALNARAWLGRLHWLDGDPEEADRQIGRAIEGLERLPPSAELANAYSNRSQSAMLQPDAQAGEMWARRAIAVAEETGAVAPLVHAYNNLGTSLLLSGDASGPDFLRRSLALALEHHLTDDAGRAYANLSGQGARIFPFPYAESEAFLLEAMAFAGRTIPGGVFDQWIRSGYAEFLISTARWTDAERVLDSMDETRAGAYLGVEYRTLRAHLLAHRGRYDEAAAMTTTSIEDSLRIADLQSVMPTLACVAAIGVGLGNDAEAVSNLRRAMERRGTNPEILLSSWFLFEAVDTVTSMAVGRPDSPALATGVDLLDSFTARLAPDAVRGGELAQADVRRALLGAAVEQLGTLGASTSVPLPGRAEAAAVLDREHRRFDAARIRLWLAEEASDASHLADAADVFEELAAHPYLARARNLRRS